MVFVVFEMSRTDKKLLSGKIFLFEMAACTLVACPSQKIDFTDCDSTKKLSDKQKF